MRKLTDFKNKKVAVVGLSVEGIDTAQFFLALGAQVVCCDRQSSSQFPFATLPFDKKKVRWQMGDEYLKNIENCDLIVRTPGMLLHTAELQAAKALGKEVTSSIQLFLELCKGKTIGITGTKGKGTTATLIATMLKNTGFMVYLGGNIGVPLLSKVSHIEKNDWVILELSSFQLENLTISPHVAVVLPITEDHLKNFDPHANNAHSTLMDYYNAKARIVEFQKKTDIAILNQDNQVSRSFSSKTPAKIYRYSGQSKDAHAQAYVARESVFLNLSNKELICKSGDLLLVGRHNLENIAVASLVARLIGVTVSTIQKTVKNFAPLPHHLECVGEIHGVTFYNDSSATIPDPTIAAIHSFKGPIILIAGGSDKGANFDELGREILKGNVVSVIVIGQVGPAIASAIKNASKILSKPSPRIIAGKGGMKEIVLAAVKIANKGDVVLLSPAAASFDMFKNYKDRGDQFKTQVYALSKNTQTR